MVNLLQNIEMLFQEILISVFLIFLTSFSVSFYLFKKIIYVSHKKHLFDEPSEARKIHKAKTPNLGGVGLFVGSFLSLLLFADEFSTNRQNFIVLGLLITFLLGLMDDLVGMNPLKKLGGQLIAAILIVIPGEIHITSLFGLFGIDEISGVVGILCSVLFILVLVNAYNLIDGINYLTSVLGIFSSLIFATLFLYAGDFSYALIALAIAGSLIAFICFNRTPAKLFLGDSGSMTIGLIIAIFSIHSLEFVTNQEWNSSFSSVSMPSLVLAIILVPVFDVFRVFYLRLIRRTSPFVADRNHIHHKLLELGFNHLYSTMILLGVTFLALIIAYVSKNLRIDGVLIVLFGYCLLLNSIGHYYFTKKQKNIKYHLKGRSRMDNKEQDFENTKLSRKGRVVILQNKVELLDS